MRFALPFVVAATLLAGCPGRNNNVECRDNTSCDLAGGGVCLTTTSGRWCAYPDPACPSGYRYSDQDVGGGVSGECTSGIDAGVDTPDAPVDGPQVIAASWGKQIPGAGFESVDAVALAADGSVFITGSYDGSLDLGGGPMSAYGTYDIFVAKFTADGSHIWSKHYGGGAATAGGSEIAVLPTGEVILGGTFRGTINFGPTQRTAMGQDIFITKLASNGDPVWAVSTGTSDTDRLRDLDVDSTGNIAICGAFNGSGTLFGTSVSGSYDPFIARLLPTGSPTWVKPITAGGIDDNCAVAMMANGDVSVVANFNGTVNVGGSTFTSTTNTLDFLLARFAAADGGHVWSVQKGGAGNEEALDIAASGTSVIVSGSITSAVDLGAGPLTYVGGGDALIAKFDAGNGNHIWSKSMGGPSGESGTHVAVRSDGQASMVGTFTGTANFGGTMLTTNEDYDPFAVDVDGSNGAVLSVKSVGGTGRDEAHDVASSTDSLMFAGSFGGSINILGTTYTAMGSALDGYVVRFKR